MIPLTARGNQDNGLGEPVTGVSLWSAVGDARGQWLELFEWLSPREMTLAPCLLPSLQHCSSRKAPKAPDWQLLPTHSPTAGPSKHLEVVLEGRRLEWPKPFSLS